MDIINNNIIDFLKNSVPHKEFSVTPSQSTNSIYVKIDGVELRFSDHYNKDHTSKLQVLTPSCVDTSEECRIVFYKETNIPMLMTENNLLPYLQVTCINLIMEKTKNKFDNIVKKKNIEDIKENKRTIYDGINDIFAYLQNHPDYNDKWGKLGPFIGSFDIYKDLNNAQKEFLKFIIKENYINMEDLQYIFNESKIASVFYNALYGEAFDYIINNRNDMQWDELYEFLKNIQVFKSIGKANISKIKQMFIDGHISISDLKDTLNAYRHEGKTVFDNIVMIADKANKNIVSVIDCVS